MTGIDMNGKVALVTGGAGGIGAAACRRLAEAGAKVILADLLPVSETQPVADSLPGEGHLAVQVSITDSDGLKQLALKIGEEYGKLNLLVNNAGVTTNVPHEDLEGLTDEWIDRIFQINWRGGFACIRAFKDLLMAGEGGVVVNISSVAAVTGVGSNVAYCASKAAVESMTRSLARALAPKIRVVSVAPGWVLGDYAKKMSPEYLKAQTDLTPLNRLAAPEDVAEAILVVSETLTFTTGSIISVDGGRPLL